MILTKAKRNPLWIFFEGDMPKEKLIPKNMKSEKKYSKAIKNLRLLLLLFVACLSYTSCITINQLPDHKQMNPFADPVCGMKVDTTTALKTDYNGRTYYFDSEECQKVFLKSPEKFTADQASHQNNHTMSQMGWMGGAAMVAIMALAMTSMIIFGGIR